MKTKTLLAAAGPLAALTLLAAPAAAQDYRYDRDRGDDSTRDALLGAAVGALAGAVIGGGDGTYIIGGALAGAAVGVGGQGDDCGYRRDGRCYRNLGHWEREHGIDRNDRAYGGQYGQYAQQRYVDGRTYRGQGYYRDGRFWRNPGEWRSEQDRRDRDYRYDRRW